jgi:hypothetical protein
MPKWWKRAQTSIRADSPVVTAMGLEELLQRLLEIKTDVEEAQEAMDYVNPDDTDIDHFNEASGYMFKAYAKLHCVRIELGSQDGADNE